MVIFVYCVNGLRVLYKWGARHKTNGKISHSRRMSHMQVVVIEVKGDVLLGDGSELEFFQNFDKLLVTFVRKCPQLLPQHPTPIFLTIPPTPIR